MDELKALIEKQGEAFDAFKKTHEELKKNDTLTAEKLARIEKSLDDAVEAKAAIEAKLTAEAKEREALELRLARKGNAADGKTADEAKAFGLQVKAHAASLGRPAPADVSETDYAAYKAGFGLFVRRGKEELGPDERKAMSVGIDADGGYLVTPDIGGRIVTKVYETSPIRQIASVQAISSDALEGVEDLDEAGSGGWVGETASRGETSTPQIGKWKIEVFELFAQPKITQKLLDDASVNVEQWLADKVAERLARVENAAFVSGTGAGQPKGLASYDTLADSGSGVAWGKIGHVVSGANGGFAAANPGDKLIDLIGTVKDAYLASARFMTRRSVITAIRKFKDGQGNYLWQPSFVAGQPETILAYPVTRNEDMPALATGSKSLYFGNFAAAYQIVDRLGIRVLRDNLTEKPYVKFYTTKRTGGGVINFEAVKAMVFST